MKVIEMGKPSNRVGVKGLVVGHVYRGVGTPEDGTCKYYLNSLILGLNGFTSLVGSGFKVYGISLSTCVPYYFHERDVGFVFEPVEVELHVVKG